MADEENKEEVAPKKSGGKGLLIALLVVIVLLLGAIGGGAYYLYSTGALDSIMGKETAKEDKQNKSNQDESKSDESDNDTGVAKYSAKFENIILNITKNNGRNALMKLAFTIKSSEEEIEARATENTAEIMDAVISIISTKTAEELRTLGGKEVLKEELLISINDILNAGINEDNEDDTVRDGVKKLFFVNFVIK